MLYLAMRNYSLIGSYFGGQIPQACKLICRTGQSADLVRVCPVCRTPQNSSDSNCSPSLCHIISSASIFKTTQNMFFGHFDPENTFVDNGKKEIVFGVTELTIRRKQNHRSSANEVYPIYPVGLPNKYLFSL